MSQKDIEQLEEQLRILKSSEQRSQFQKLLDNIKSTNYETYLENRIFETEYGCWILMAPTFRNYPEKIYKFVDEKITGFVDVKYYVLGKQVEHIPPTQDIIKLGTFPDQICELRIANEHHTNPQNYARYHYVFSKKICDSYHISCRQKVPEYAKVYEVLYMLNTILKNYNLIN
jgi:hypothetical protein